MVFAAPNPDIGFVKIYLINVQDAKRRLVTEVDLVLRCGGLVT